MPLVVFSLRVTRFFRRWLFVLLIGLSLGLLGWSWSVTASGSAGQVADIFPGSDSSRVREAIAPRQQIAFNDLLVFRAADRASTVAQGTFSLDSELWVSDGTSGGTNRVIDLVTGVTGSFPEQFLVVDSTLFFVAQGQVGSSRSGTELFTTDLTEAGTRIVRDIGPGSASSFPQQLTLFDDRLFFTIETDFDGSAGNGPTQLWVSDGSEAGTQPLLAMTPSDPQAGPRFVMAVGDRLFFSEYSADHGRELWVSDGTAEGTALLVDLRPGATGSDPTLLVSVGDRVFFTADDGVYGRELWVSDGTVEGTERLSDAEASRPISNPVVFAGKFYFIQGEQIWESDGTPKGTRMAIDPRLFDTEYRYASGLSVAGDRMFFFTLGGTPSQLWVSDGTQAGSYAIGGMRLAGDIAPFAVNGNLVFAASPSLGSVNFELWVSDGSAAGTKMLQDLYPGVDPNGTPYAGYPTDFIVAAGQLFFYAGNEDGRELWSLPLAALPPPEPIVPRTPTGTLSPTPVTATATQTPTLTATAATQTATITPSGSATPAAAPTVEPQLYLPLLRGE
jgi:ELWxxDGT repeat protein